MQPEPNTAFSRDDVNAFLRTAQHVLDTEPLNPVSRASLQTRLAMIRTEADQPDPRWHTMRIWARGLTQMLNAVISHPEVRARLHGSPWP